MRRSQADRGAAVVEFALVVPLLLLLTLGIIAFGHAFHVQTVIDNAARDAVRVFTLSDVNADTAARTVAEDGVAVAVDPSVAVIGIPASCPSGSNAIVTISLADYTLLGGMWSVDLTGTGTMRCT